MTRDPQKRPRCEQCTKQPSFNLPGSKQARWCAEHAAAHGGVDVVSKRCEADGCTTLPGYGLPGAGRQWCLAHAPPGAVSANGNKCQQPGCLTHPSFAVPSDPSRRYCAAHRPADAAHVLSKRCEAGGCTRQPSFGTQGSKLRRWCLLHAENGAVDVVSKRCEADGCTKHPSFNLQGLKVPRWCAGHAENGAVDVVHRRCEADGCTKKPKFNLPGIKLPRFCLEHAQNGAVNVVAKRCAHEDCDVIVHRKPLCATHDVDAVHKRRQRVRENQVAAFLRNNGLQWTTWDRQVKEASCGRFRPDFTFELPTHIVIVEVDEDQHSAYDQSCERKRMLDIFSSYGGTPVTFLRYNPDRFQVDGATVRHTAVARQQMLAQRLQAALATTPSHPLSIEYLFYDGAAVATYHVFPDDPSFTLHPEPSV